MLEDELLKWKFRRGSREALARIYEKYLDSMLTLAMGLLNNASEAEDVVHDVFVSFAQVRAGDFRAPGQPERLSGHQRRQPRAGSPKAARRRQAGGLQPAEAEPDVCVDRTARARPDGHLHRAGRPAQSGGRPDLPEEQREVVLLRLTADMKFRDIAKLQQVSINTVQGRYRYGLRPAAVHAQRRGGQMKPRETSKRRFEESCVSPPPRRCATAG